MYTLLGSICSPHISTTLPTTQVLIPNWNLAVEKNDYSFLTLFFVILFGSECTTECKRRLSFYLFLSLSLAIRSISYSKKIPLARMQQSETPIPTYLILTSISPQELLRTSKTMPKKRRCRSNFKKIVAGSITQYLLEVLQNKSPCHTCQCITCQQH